MTTIQNSRSEASSHSFGYYLAWIFGGLGVIVLSAITAFLLLVFSQLPAGQQALSFSSWLFAANTQQWTWYVTRAAGLTAYLLLWLSTAWGLAVPSRILDGVLHGSFTFDFHQFISLLALGFLGLHIVVLTLDQYAPFTLAQILFPFLSDYRPLWTGIGVLAMYLTVLVTVTFYLRSRIGMKAFRAIHLLSLLAYFGGLVHAITAGTDSPLPAVQWMYAGTFLTVVFLLTYYLIGQLSKKKKTATVKANRPA